MKNQPSATQTTILSALLFLLTFSVLRLWAPLFASSEKYTILGGFVSSLLFFFTLLTIGNLKSETGWIEVVISLVIAMGTAATVHRVCVTTCFLFSLGLLYWMSQVSQSINKKILASNVGTPKKRR